MLRAVILILALALAGVAEARTPAEILAASRPEEWRAIPPERLLLMRLANGGEVVIELAPNFAPRAAANVGRLARSGYYDGLAVLRVQDNYVTQWGDPAAGTAQARTPPSGFGPIPAEFSLPRRAAPFVRLQERDAYAPEIGFSGGMPAARNRREIWLAHCYAMVGVGRDNAPDSGDGRELYVVIGHAPRHLDRNITLVGRVISGMEQLAALPRGSGPLGFYTETEQPAPIASVRVAADIPGVRWEALRENSASFKELLDSRRNRREAWFVRPSDAIDLCNAPLPARRLP